MSISDDIAAAKAAARNHARAARCALDAASCDAAAESLAELLLSLPELKLARLVLAYGATPEEIDPAPAVAALRARGVAVAMPRIEAPGVLGVHLVAHDDDLDSGPYGLTQPKPEAPRVPLHSIDAVLVPGVAFDANGFRLGYGGGYYDRLMPQLRADCLTIGIAYDEQILPKIPAEEHDICVRAVVTPSRILWP